MFSVTYPIAVETTLEEYTRMLFRQGGMQKAYASCSLQTHLKVVSTVLEQALQSKDDQNFDLAYVKFARVIQIIDEEKLREKAAGSDLKSIRSALGTALKNEEEIRRVNLPELLQQQNDELNAVKSEREKIIAQQMEVDDDADIEEERLEHERRRLQLLGESAVPLSTVVSPAEEVTDYGEEFHRLRRARLQEMEALHEAELQAKLIGSSRTVIPSQVRPLEKPPEVVLHTPVSPAIGLPAPPSQASLAKPKMTTAQTPKSEELRIIKPPPRPPKEPGLSASSSEVSRRLASWKFETHSAPTQSRRGLVNLGNTCYMNSVLQCIAQTELGYFVTSTSFTRELDQTCRKPIVSAFTFLMREFQTPLATPVNPARLKAEVAKQNDMFADKSQQDASEFLRTMLDGMHEEINTQRSTASALDVDNSAGEDEEIAKRYWEQYRQRNSSIIVSLFTFQERSALLCPNCRYNPRSFNPVMGIEVPIPSLPRQVSIEDCLSAYCKKEILDADSLYNCGNCKRKVAASKQLSFHSLPRNLVITLKRFRSHGNFSDKVQTPVAFQRTIDMQPYVTSEVTMPTKFKLVGVVNHQGNIHGGHYTADVMGMRDGLWYNFSDEVVRPSTAPNFVLAYSLLYLQLD